MENNPEAFTEIQASIDKTEQKLRDEKKFNSLDELKVQMQKDIELAKVFFE